MPRLPAGGGAELRMVSVRDAVPPATATLPNVNVVVGHAFGVGFGVAVGVTQAFGDGGSICTASANVSVQLVAVRFVNVTGATSEPNWLPCAPPPVVHCTVGKVNPVVGRVTVNVCEPLPLVIVAGLVMPVTLPTVNFTSAVPRMPMPGSRTVTVMAPPGCTVARVAGGVIGPTAVMRAGIGMYENTCVEVALIPVSRFATMTGPPPPPEHGCADGGTRTSTDVPPVRRIWTSRPPIVTCSRPSSPRPLIVTSVLRFAGAVSGVIPVIAIDGV